MSRLRIPVRSGGGATDYHVLIEAGLRHGLPDLLRECAPRVHRWVVIADAHTAPLYGRPAGDLLAAAGMGGQLFTTPAGEAHKTLHAWETLTHGLLDAGLGRDGGVLAVGGGVVTDLAGFVAATFMRGIPVVQLPTSLLAMIDASVGGKTGVDTPQGKNLVGAFHPPAAVIMDPEVLETLPRGERAQGLVEAVKHGAIRDRGYGEVVAASAAAILDGELERVVPVLEGSVRIKAEVVSQDEREAGLREVLNFGHTVGHALERCSGYGLAHGTAVARGMLWEARLGEGLGVTSPGTAELLREWLGPLELPLAGDPVDPDELIRGLRMDKKARGGGVRTVLLAEAGRVAGGGDSWSHAVAEREILAAAD